MKNIIADFFSYNYFDIIFAVLIVFGFLAIQRLKATKRLSFPTLLLLAFLFALVAGVFMLLISSFLHGFNSDMSYIDYYNKMMERSFVKEGLVFVKDLFLTLMKLMVVPLVFFSILNVTITHKMQSRRQLVSIFSGFILTVLLGAIVGIFVSILFDVGNGMSIAVSKEELARFSEYVAAVKDYQLFTFIQSFVPSNLVEAMMKGNVIGIMIFAALMGMGVKRAMKRYNEEMEVVIKFINGIFHVLTYMVRTILSILPYSIFAMIVLLIVARDFASLTNLIWYFIAIMVAIFILFIVHMLVLALQGLSPIQYVKNVLPALVVAFSTASSNATLPVTITTLKERTGVSDSVATLVPTLGTSMGMTGCGGIFPAIIVMLTLNAMGEPITASLIVMTLVYGVLASFGTQGIPGTATIAATFVLTSLGLPLGALVLVAPIDFFVDMFRTALNVNGSMVVAISSDHAMNTFDENAFYAENEKNSMTN